MTRNDFYEQALLSTKDVGLAKKMLEARDKERNESAEFRDISNFINETKNFKLVKLITPFGECALAVPPENIKALADYLKGKYCDFRLPLANVDGITV